MSRIPTPRALGAVALAISLAGAGCGSSSPPSRQLAPHAQAVLDRHIAEARRAMSLGDQTGVQNALAALSSDVHVFAARRAADPSQLALLALEIDHARARVPLDVHPAPIAQQSTPTPAIEGTTGNTSPGTGQAPAAPTPPGASAGDNGFPPGLGFGQAGGDNKGRGHGDGHGHGKQDGGGGGGGGN